MSGYRLTVNRYGEERRGEAVLIYVTEPFSEKKRVKVNDPGADGGDTFEALKLNLVRDFRTGIYDYNTMVSVFARSSDFAPVKITFTSAEWCGHAYQELLFGKGGIENTLHSYFEGESGTRKLRYPKGGIVEDNLFILLRGLRGPFLEAGREESFAFLPGTFYGRLLHQPLDWTTAKIGRQKKPEEIEVPAGAFRTIVYEIEIAGGRRGRFHIEEEYPHRIVRWELGSDTRAELTGSKRLAYWRLNAGGHESHLAEIGLPAAPH